MFQAGFSCAVRSTQFVFIMFATSARSLLRCASVFGCLLGAGLGLAADPAPPVPVLTEAERAAYKRVELHAEPIPAFPGAEGYGARTRGGRGGKVFVVENLNDAGPGSYREACEAEGPRTVVFGVAGIIDLQTPVAINHPFITIAGQSAPGDGVCIKGETTEINTHDVIIRYMRFRRGNLKRRDDALGGNPIGNIIIDHCSCSWGLDENLTLYRHMVPMPDGSPADKRPVANLTIQWCVSSEALNLNNHAFGGTWGGQGCTFHHNLFACNTGRNPSIGMSFGFDFRNNVLFNWQHRTMDGGDGSSRVNVVNNYYKAGPATEGELRHRLCRAQARNARDRYPGFGKWYVEGNFIDGFPEITANNWAGGVQYDEAVTIRKNDIVETIPAGTEELTRSRKEFEFVKVSTDAANVAYELVLAGSGATLPRRDPVDERVMAMVRSGQPTYKNGIIDTPADVGGWPAYTAESIPADRDRDGLPDDWETKHGCSATDASDANRDADGDGYTNLEEFLNGTPPQTK
jgi:pectate lyase